MNKILLILQREYLSRVQKKTFLLATFLTPILFGGLYALSIYVTLQDSDSKVVSVIDDSGYFAEKLDKVGGIEFEYLRQGLKNGRLALSEGAFYGLLYIPSDAYENVEGITLYSEGNIGIEAKMGIKRNLEDILKEIKIDKLGLDRAILNELQTNIELKTVNISGNKEKESNVEIATAIGVMCGVLIYMFMLIYGTQVMRSVMQEKLSKIVEILVSSVKPFQLMMGKILGIAAVGLTQMVLWLLLSLLIMNFTGGSAGIETEPNMVNTLEIDQNTKEGAIANILEMVGTLNIPLIIVCFFFYFLTGYLLYAALFAMVGSAVDSEADTQQFMMPIMIPIIASMMLLSAVIKDPNGSIAFWLSIIPFTSPVIMMVRIPFEVPSWQLLLSMALMVIGFLCTTWVAGKVYRVGILMHGSKVNLRVLAKWFMMKN